MRALAFLLLLSPVVAAAEKPVVIQNATVYDGSGSPGVKAAVEIRDGKITAIAAKIEVGVDTRVIDGTGLIVCPGFIDLHTHSDSAVVSKTLRPDTCYAVQGVTTIVTGNCGSGPVDVAKFFHDIEAGGVGSNVIHQVPHNDVRSQVMGNANRKPTADELKKMEELVEKGMADGAWGLATGLIYNPGTYAKTEEIVALAKVSAKHGGHYASHIRNEGGNLLDAIQEAITVGKESGCPVHVSHIKASGKAAHGLSARAVALIEGARKSGQKVTADQYPYTASSTSLRATIVPTRYREGSTKDYVARYADPQTGPQLKADLAEAISERDHGKAIQIASYSKKPKWQGKRLSEIAEMEKKDVLDIVIEIETNGGAQIVNFGMNEEDVRVYMKQPWVATASDGSAKTAGESVPHPRSYGTFPRKVGFYSIEEKTIPLEQAIRSCSGLPADILGFKDRGYIKVGQFADVVVFDPKTFRDTATYEKPHQLAPGVKYLFVNGVLTIDDGKHKPDVLPGKVLRHAK
ncbi:N-acyl-D-amino-acid deacylase family protein [Limnoglobus roseus]|uniref:D-aminoacylase n=1 Tax=Limnoglobus roseus TaxID=2598579 RepID=A0A5C1AGD8_9BACT|nr:D-aminoacylase [Limnoglobus roseus]QEL16028.1 D-aminoacylase [Limnoglobus roseus]